jgi:hypothetical protein
VVVSNDEIQSDRPPEQSLWLRHRRSA